MWQANERGVTAKPQYNAFCTQDYILLTTEVENEQEKKAAANY